MSTLLVAISAKNIHKALAPWCIKAYCEKQEPGLVIDILECSINDRISDILASIYHCQADIVAFSCYLWNIELITKVAPALKALLPHCTIVLGGPELAEVESHDFPWADYIIQGPGECAFHTLLINLRRRGPAGPRLIKGENFCVWSELPSPYTVDYFTSFADSKMLSIANQLVYYESSRGCPFSCAFCLSSASSGVEYLPLERVKQDLQRLLEAGAECIKFVDRTFNANRARAHAILEYIKALDTACVFHFEVAADLFDNDLLDLIATMPHGRVQFELGIQSTHSLTLQAVSRQTDTAKSLAHITTLTAMQNCRIHVDLIAGLPYDTLETIARALDQCLECRPHILQLGFLKCLKGSKMPSIARELGYSFCPYPPYEVLHSNSLSFAELVELKAVEVMVDKFYNSAMFKNTLAYAGAELFDSTYTLFRDLSRYANTGGDFKLSLKHAYTLLKNFLSQYADRPVVEHYIKLDCLTYDPKGQLPDDITFSRDKARELEVKKQSKAQTTPYNKVRVEYFPFDGRYRLFIYDERDPLTKAYRVITLES